jgi:RNA polymerase sigma factor (sigma-70 family)
MKPQKVDRPALGIVRGLVTDAERHRIILAHSFLVDEIAARFRGRKGIPFEELQSQAMLGLVAASQYAGRVRGFKDYAARCVDNSVRNFIDGWQMIVSGSPETLPEREFWEWGIWSYAAPYEQWTSISATPEQIIGEFQNLHKFRAGIQSALIGVDSKARGIFAARFFRDPPQDLQSIAREYKMSYWATVRSLKRTLNTLREKLESSAKKTA